MLHSLGISDGLEVVRVMPELNLSKSEQSNTLAYN